MNLLETEQLKVSIGGQVLCRDLDLVIQPGESWAILGKNGSGKTTLLHTLAGLRNCDSGKILLKGRDLNSLPRREVALSMGVLFQEQHDPFPATALEIVLTGRHPFLGTLQWESTTDREIANRALADMDLNEFQQRDIRTLSGGERQRVGIARLLSQNPQLALLDEPTNHLDLHHQIHVLEKLQQHMNNNEGAMMICLHDINLAVRFCTHALLMFGNGDVCQGSVGEILETDILEKLYGHPMRKVSALPHDLFFPA